MCRMWCYTHRRLYIFCENNVKKKSPLILVMQLNFLGAFCIIPRHSSRLEDGSRAWPALRGCGRFASARFRSDESIQRRFAGPDGLYRVKIWWRDASASLRATRGIWLRRNRWRNPTDIVCASLNSVILNTEKKIILTGSSPREELNRSETFETNSNVTLPWDDSIVLHCRIIVWKFRIQRCASIRKIWNWI